MRFPSPSHVFVLPMILAAASALPARVGETREEFERRLLQPNVGKFVLRERAADPFRDAEELRQQPFNAARAFFPDEIRERKYWKSAVPNVLSNENGWFVHVFYREGVSVMEAYQRVGAPINEYEIRNILTVNQCGSEWRESDAESEDTVIGRTFQLVDGMCAALHRGNWLVVYSGEFDALLKERRKAREQAGQSEAEERRRRQQEEAPGSTSGF